MHLGLVLRRTDGGRGWATWQAAASRNQPFVGSYGGLRVARQPRPEDVAPACQREYSRRTACDAERPKNTRQRSAKRERQMALGEEYRERLGNALKAELDEEVRAMKERLQDWSKQRLLAEGYALFELPGKMDGRLYKDRVVRFLGSGMEALLPPHHLFNEGDMVAISQKGPLDESEDIVEGVVLERAKRFLRVSIRSADAAHLDMGMRWRLDLSSNTVAYERSLAAVLDFSNITPGRSEVSTPQKDETMGSSIGEACMAVSLLRLTAPQEAGCETMTPKLKEALRFASKPPPWGAGPGGGAQRGAVRKLLGEVQGSPLNASQVAAIEATCERRLTLWVGPPGTGKTRTLLRYLWVMCKVRPEARILATADSNTAVDNLLEGLLRLGLKVVRVGHPSKVAEQLREHTLDALLSTHPLTLRAHQLRSDSVMQRQAARKMNNPKQRRGAAVGASREWDSAAKAEAAAVAHILDAADVVLATCVGAGDPVLEGRQFEVVVVDEATQANEAAALIPILRSGAHTCVLVGDPAQLPPTVISQAAIHLGLDVSLFERLHSSGLCPLFLNTQYRMHPAIAAFPSTQFYGGLLHSFPRPADRPAPDGIAWPRPAQPLLFLDCSEGREESSGEGSSKRNTLEANAVVRLVTALLAKGLSGRDIGVISPYSAQVRLLRDLVAETGLEEAEQVEIKTVDGFQGREKEVILVSTVRSNPEARLGFVAEQRRMNVALTRAKRGLVVVGALSTLKHDAVWGAWVDHMRGGDVVLTLSAAPWE